MSKAILCLDMHGSAQMRRLNLVDYAPDLFSPYLFTPTPNDHSGLSFFEEKARLLTAMDYSAEESTHVHRQAENWRSILSHLETIEHIELWIGPSLNDHILAFHFLSLISKQNTLKSRLLINFIPNVTGVMNERMMLSSMNQASLPSDGICDEAELYWNAFRSPSPEMWVDLLGNDVKHFPHFNFIRKKYTLSLPITPTNLRLVDLQVLRQLANNRMSAGYVLGHVLANDSDTNRTLTEFEIWEAMVRLANSPQPAITGFPKAKFDYFSDTETDRSQRRESFKAPLQLSAFGEALLSENVCWTDKNTHDYWWGGTHINDNNMWSIDPKENRLRNHCQGT